jgi:hypothetical protein
MGSPLGVELEAETSFHVPTSAAFNKIVPPALDADAVGWIVVEKFWRRA